MQTAEIKNIENVREIEQLKEFKESLESLVKFHFKVCPVELTRYSDLPQEWKEK